MDGRPRVVCMRHGADGLCDAGTENAYLRAWFRAQKETAPVGKSLHACLLCRMTEHGSVLPSASGSSKGGC